MINVRETGLQSPEGNSIRRQHAPGILRELRDDLMLPPPADPGQKRDVVRIRTGLEIQVVKSGTQELGFRIQQVGGHGVECIRHREIPARHFEVFRLDRITGSVRAGIGPIYLILTGRQNLVPAFLQERGVQFAVGRRPVRKGVAPDRVAIIIREADPAPVPGVRIAGIELFQHPRVIALLAGRQIHFSRRPDDFVFAFERVAIMRDFLVRASLAIFCPRPFQKFPPAFGFFQIERRFLGELFLEQRRPGHLRQRRHADRRDGGGLRIHHLRVAIFRQHIAFIFPVARVDHEIETAIVVLHFRHEIRFPFRELQHVALAVTALGQAEIVQRPHPWHHVHRKTEGMNKRRGVAGIFAVIAGIVMPLGHIHLAGFDIRIQAGIQFIHARRPRSLALGKVRSITGQHALHGFEFSRRNLCRRCVAGRMREPRKWELQGCTAALMVNPQGIRPRKIRGQRVRDRKRKGGAQAGHRDPVLTGHLQLAEVGSVDLLVRHHSIPEFPIRVQCQLPAIHFVAGRGVHNREAGFGRDGQFP